MEDRALDVLAYFLRNRRAVDTLEGVARWRLLEEDIHRGVDEAQEALGWLVEQGLLVQERPTYGEPVFRLNHEMIGEAERLLRSAHRRKGET